MQPLADPAQRQPLGTMTLQLSRAAREEGLPITSDQGFQYDRFITQSLDGYTGVEHALNTCDVRRDVVELLGRLGITYAPQLSMTPEFAKRVTEYLRSHPRSWWSRKSAAPNGTAVKFDLEPRPSASAACRAQIARDLLRAGVNVVLATDSDVNGLKQHQALWGFASGGMTNAEILRVATMNGARGLGMAEDLGSIEAGKIADLIVLDGNPLEDVTQTIGIRYVVKDGTVYDSEVLDAFDTNIFEEPWDTEVRRPSSGSRVR